MKQSNFKLLLKTVQALAEAKKKKASVKKELANQSAIIIKDMQHKVNRRLLAVAVAEACSVSDAGQADKLFHTVWKNMEQNMLDAQDVRIRAGAVVNLVMQVQEVPSPLVIPTGESKVFTSIHSLAELEKVLRQERDLVEQLRKQGLNIKAKEALTHALQEVSVEFLKKWEERAWALGLIISKRPSSKGFQHLCWVNGKPVNTYEYKGIQAVRAACNGEEASPSDLVSGCNSLVQFAVNAALQHKQLANIESENFWIASGRMNFNPVDLQTGRRDYYPGEEGVEVRRPWFDLVNVRPDEEIVRGAIENSKEDCKAIAESAMELAKGLDKALGEKAKYWDGQKTTQDLGRLIGAVEARLAADASKREEAFAAKKAGIELASARDAHESWEIAAVGCNAAQKAQLLKLRKEMGLGKGKDVLEAEVKKSVDFKYRREQPTSPEVTESLEKLRKDRRKAMVLADMIAEIKQQLEEA